MSIPSTGIPSASIAAPQAPAGGGGMGILQLLTQLLGGNYAPTGLGTHAPASLGPNPVREVDASAFGRGGEAGSDFMGHIMRALAPYIALMGGGANVMPSTGGVNISDPAKNFLAQILTSVLSPASAAPTAGGLPSAGAPVRSAAPGVAGGGVVPTSFGFGGMPGEAGSGGSTPGGSGPSESLGGVSPDRSVGGGGGGPIM